MDKNKQYYLDLVERWFDAETTEAEETDLKLFLAGTDDPAFDEARAAFGYLSAQAAAAKVVPVASKQRRVIRFVPAIAVAASLAAAFVLGRLTATDVTVKVEQSLGGSYYSYVNGIKVADEEFAMREMESTLEDLFAPAPDPAEDLASMFNRK